MVTALKGLLRATILQAWQCRHGGVHHDWATQTGCQSSGPQRTERLATPAAPRITRHISQGILRSSTPPSVAAGATGACSVDQLAAVLGHDVMVQGTHS
ncbi:MAG: hypothetical protein CFE44_26840 [Burkholderiales bacterium PBB4]|nr:MAG: hypothetical protein CFE44_26840 [Burkholderiales bacterium PBB4]